MMTQFFPFMQRRMALLAAAIAMLSFATTHVSAGTLVLEYSQLKDATPVPGGTPPWIRATFTDADPDSNAVDLRIDSLLQSDGEFITTMGFNVLNNATSNLTLSLVSKGADVGTVNLVQPSPDGYQPGGGSGDNYDFGVEFATANAGRFDDSDYVVLRLTSSSGTISAQNFLAVSSPGGFYSIAHIQGLGPNNKDSNWAYGAPAVVPEPSTFALGLGALGLLGLASLRRRRAD